MKITAPSLPPRRADVTLNRSPALWALRISWLVLPLVSGPLFGEALAASANAYRTTASAALWGLWVVGLLATLLPHPRTLTAIRVLATGAVPFGFWALVAGAISGWAVIGTAALLVAAGLALVPHLAAVFVDGESYGDERRLPLRPPAAVLLGPVPLAWLMCVAGSTVGPLLLASGRWLSGAIVTVIGLPLSAIGYRSLHTLARRFLVFVPAGLVVHDLTALVDPVLFRREDIDIIGPAFADSVAYDLTLGASGLALEARFARPLSVPVRRQAHSLRRHADSQPEPQDLRAVLISPSQPGVVLGEAERRRLPVG